MNRVLIYGRTNVGKSTLFNLLVGKKKAIVHDEQGVTRDCLTHDITRFGSPFTLVDTPGFFHDIHVSDHKEFQDAMLASIEKELDRAAVILFVIDGLAGVTPLDERLSKKVRKYAKKVIVVVNKCESEKTAYQDAYALGFDNVCPISAQHTVGLSELTDRIERALPNTLPMTPSDDSSETPTHQDEQEDIKIAILGRPNVGKSTLINTLLGTEAQLVADMDGVTRDSVAYKWNYHGTNFEIIDTPGIRRSKNKAGAVEKQAIELALKAMDFAHIVVLVVDATQDVSQGIDRQELDLARKIIHEGRAIVIALNKADKVENIDAIKKAWQLYFDENMSQIKGLSFVAISAKNNRGIDNLLRVIQERYASWQSRLSTSRLNDWLAYCTEKVPPPLVKGRRIKLKYITQIRSKPPSFRIISNFAKEVPENYRRYLVNTLLKDFNLHGVPIRLMFREGSKNPYAKPTRKT